MPYRFATPVQWIPRSKGTGKAYNRTEYVDGTPVSTSAVWAPGGSFENVQGAETVTTQPTLYGVDAALNVTALDVFVVNGDRYEVDGEPQKGLMSPFSGWTPGLVVQLRKVNG